MRGASEASALADSRNVALSIINPLGHIPIVVLVRRDCLFSSVALERLHELALDDPRINITERYAASPSQERSPAVTPVTLLPNGRRITGTPSIERLRQLVARYFGAPRDVANKVWYLQRNRLFNGIPLKEVEAMAHLFREVDYPPRSVIFQEGDVGDAIYLLKTGHVRIYRLTEDGQEATLALLGPGSVFGELALFHESHRLTVAETLDDAHICATSVDDFTRLMRHKPQLTMMVAYEIARRQTHSETRIAGTAYATVRGRVISVLRHLAEEHGQAQADGSTRVGIRLSHQQIASFAGASREACSTAISKLQKLGVLSVDDTHCFVIADLNALKPGTIDSIVKRALG